MKKVALFLGVVCLALFGVVVTKAYAANATKMTAEVLVLNSAAVEMPRLTGSKGFEIYNHGPNNIFCALGSSADAVLDKSRPIAPETFWGVDANSNTKVYCKAKTADQVTGAASIMTEKGSP